VSSFSEQGFKVMRGALTEGRYIVFELGGYALTNAGKPATDFTAIKATSNHEQISQRWVVHALTTGGNTFTISSARDGRYIGAHTGLIDNNSGAEVYTVSFVQSKGYALQKENGKYVTIDGNGDVQIVSQVVYFNAYSVTYSS
jgi:phospholipase C